MWKRVPYLIKISIFVAITGILYFLCDQATWGFTVARLQSHFDLGLPNRGNPHPYLKQKYYLADQGGQSYVFFSEDGNYVLKFFKDMPRPWLPFRSYQKKKRGKLKRTLHGYLLAYERMREETGLLCIHFKPSQTHLPTRLIDRLHIENSIDLSSVFFVIQKKATLGTISDDELQDLLFTRMAVGIDDHDLRHHRNIGWVDNHPIILDPGRFVEILR